MNSYYKAIIQLIDTGHWLTDSISQALKKHDISEPQFNVLRILQGSRGTPRSVNFILERMIQRSSNVTRIVDKLEFKGLVERALCADDRRKMDIIITNKGSELLVVLNRTVEHFHDPMKNKLTNDELNTLELLIWKYRKE